MLQENFVSYQFNFTNKRLTTIQKGEEIWFDASDVCRILEVRIARRNDWSTAYFTGNSVNSPESISGWNTKKSKTKVTATL